jgi:hypothetical protein
MLIDTGSSATQIKRLPRWTAPWFWLLMSLSLCGLCLSICVHLGALFGHQIVPQELFFGLHIGIFVIWLPALLSLNRRLGYTRYPDSWKTLLSGTPGWVRATLYGFFGYAIINFILFMAQAPPKGYAGPPPIVVWRGFSGHWMFFYACGAVLLFKGAYSAQHDGLLPNGEPLLRPVLCPRCGLPEDKCRCFTLPD